MSRKGKSAETESTLKAVLDWEQEGAVTANGHEDSFWGDRNIRQPDCDGACTTL